MSVMLTLPWNLPDSSAGLSKDAIRTITLSFRKNNPYRVTVDRLTLLSALKRVLIFSNQSSALIKLHLESNQLVVSGQDIDYSTSAEERVPCEYGDSPMNIGFKGTFLIDILNNMGEKTSSSSWPTRAGPE